MRSPLPLRVPACLAAALLLGGPAAASEALFRLQGGMQTCIDSSSPQACRLLASQVQALPSNPAYARSSHLCREEIAELSSVVALLPKRDAVATDLMASVADVQQACMPYGF